MSVPQLDVYGKSMKGGLMGRALLGVDGEAVMMRSRIVRGPSGLAEMERGFMLPAEKRVMCVLLATSAMMLVWVEVCAARSAFRWSQSDGHKKN